MDRFIVTQAAKDDPKRREQLLHWLEALLSSGDNYLDVLDIARYVLTEQGMVECHTDESEFVS